jgi:hypothetical protein
MRVPMAPGRGRLFSIYRDNRGDLWLGTHEHGAYRSNGESFERFRPE